MYIYIHIYIYTWICIYTCILRGARGARSVIYMYILIHTYMYTTCTCLYDPLYTYIYIIHMCTCVYIHICMYACTLHARGNHFFYACSSFLCLFIKRDRLFPSQSTLFFILPGAVLPAINILVQQQHIYGILYASMSRVRCGQSCTVDVVIRSDTIH